MTLAARKEAIPDGASARGRGFWWFRWLNWVTVCADGGPPCRAGTEQTPAPGETNGYRAWPSSSAAPAAASPVAGISLPRCVTSDSLGQTLKQSILHNLENQPSLQKQRGNIGNKDGYII